MTAAALNAGIRLALSTTREHKMRSFLTVLGVIIGTGAVIGVGSIITGLDGAITNLLRSFGPNTMIVLKGRTMTHWTPEEMKRKPVSLEDARAVRDRCPSVERVSPYLWPDRGFHRVRYKGNDIYRIDIGGTEEGYAAGGTTMKFGRFISEADNMHRMPVAAVGEDIYKGLMPNEDPINKWIEVDGRQVQIVGVMDRPAAALPGQSDLRVLFPYWTMHKLFPSAREHMLVVIAYPGMLARAMDEVTVALRLSRRVPRTQPDTFSISTAEQMIEQFHKVTATVALVMVILSSIGLLVGGIGVMNIMLVSVTERTREIGIRKAVGARRSDIVLQFLTEAVVLTFMGGLIGMLLGWAVSVATRLVFPALPTMVPMWAAVGGVAVSVGVGLFFGIWPAARAARLDPVVALRYE